MRISRVTMSEAPQVKPNRPNGQLHAQPRRISAASKPAYSRNAAQLPSHSPIAKRRKSNPNRPNGQLHAQPRRISAAPKPASGRNAAQLPNHIPIAKHRSSNPAIALRNPSNVPHQPAHRHVAGIDCALGAVVQPHYQRAVVGDAQRLGLEFAVAGQHPHARSAYRSTPPWPAPPGGSPRCAGARLCLCPLSASPRRPRRPAPRAACRTPCALRILCRWAILCAPRRR